MAITGSADGAVAPVDVEGRVGYVLKQAQHALRLAMEDALRARGLTAPQYAVLSALDANPGLSGAELARRSFVTPQTMNEIVVNLQVAGLIERRRSPDNRRVQQAVLTGTGRTLVRTCHAAVIAVEERMLSRLARDERDQLLGLLRRCVGALGRP